MIQQQIVPPVKEPTKTEIQIQASHDLDDLLHHKIKQMTSKPITKIHRTIINI